MTVSLIAGVSLVGFLVIFAIMGAVAVREDDFNYDCF